MSSEKIGYEKFDHETGEAVHTPQGYEIPDPTPIAPPVGFVRQPSLFEQVRSMVRSAQLAQAAEDSGAETFEEADDFDIGDDFDPSSPYEADFEGMSAEDKALMDTVMLGKAPPPSPPAPSEAPKEPLAGADEAPAPVSKPAQPA